MERQHGAWLREIQRELRPQRLNGSQWILQIEAAREQVAALLKILDSAQVIEAYLREVAAMTPSYAGTGRVPQLIRGLTEATYGAERVPDLMRTVQGVVAELIPRLQPESEPAPLVPESTVTESRAPRSRFAKGPLSGRGDAA